MNEQTCTCNSHLAVTDGKKHNFCNEHFIPTGWELVYIDLSRPWRTLYLTGICQVCHGRLEAQLDLPEGLTGDGLFQAIYEAMWSAHPFDETSEYVDYYGKCKERSSFYRWRDALPQVERGRRFLDLFHDYDRGPARHWLEAHYPPQAHEEVYRDTGGALFSAVVRMAEENGDFDKAKAIMDYCLPCAEECGIREGVLLTSYEFDFISKVNFGGSEGIYLDCSLMGKFDDSGRHSLYVGSLKTLYTDLDACKIMGELSGALMYYASCYVNKNIHRYTPDSELLREKQRMEEKAAAKGQ